MLIAQLPWVCAGEHHHGPYDNDFENCRNLNVAKEVLHSYAQQLPIANDLFVYFLCTFYVNFMYFLCINLCTQKYPLQQLRRGSQKTVGISKISALITLLTKGSQQRIAYISALIAMNTIDGIQRGIEEGARILQGLETKKPPCGGYFYVKLVFYVAQNGLFIMKVVLIPRIELGTSPLPRVRSTN